MISVDKATRVATGLTVAGLAGVAGAISFSHMSVLALEHGQTGWRADAFPISVDGLELVASLFLVSQRRARRRPELLPWAALVAGTGASLAANIAVGGHDLVGRALAGWPAISLLVSIKLLFSMFDHGREDQSVVRDGQRTGADGPAVPGRDQGHDSPSRTVPGPVSEEAPLDLAAVADLVPAAQAARASLTAAGRSLSRGALVDRMRQDGHAVSNARASLLLKILRAEDAGKSSHRRQGAHSP